MIVKNSRVPAPLLNYNEDEDENNGEPGEPDENGGQTENQGFGWFSLQALIVLGISFGLYFIGEVVSGIFRGSSPFSSDKSVKLGNNWGNKKVGR